MAGLRSAIEDGVLAKYTESFLKSYSSGVD
jgi:hypothetical protein